MSTPRFPSANSTLRRILGDATMMAWKKLSDWSSPDSNKNLATAASLAGLLVTIVALRTAPKADPVLDQHRIKNAIDALKDMTIENLKNCGEAFENADLVATLISRCKFVGEIQHRHSKFILECADFQGDRIQTHLGLLDGWLETATVELTRRMDQYVDPINQSSQDLFPCPPQPDLGDTRQSADADERSLRPASKSRRTRPSGKRERPDSRSGSSPS